MPLYLINIIRVELKIILHPQQGDYFNLLSQNLTLFLNFQIILITLLEKKTGYTKGLPKTSIIILTLLNTTETFKKFPEILRKLKTF